MTVGSAAIREFLNTACDAVAVTVGEAKGSTPREEGATMLVSADGLFGTIGGGQLEFMAIDHARGMLKRQAREERLDVPLGPEIGQCCGGHVRLDLVRIDDRLADRLASKADHERERLPRVYLFGAGHVGHALAEALALLPVRVIVVDNRGESLRDFGQGVETRLEAVPESVVRAAPAASAFVVLTHDHALDFLITSEVLQRGDAAYAGLIGSKTKKTTFRNWFFKNGGRPEEYSPLVCPIGGSAVRDKRPSVIAALAAAEIMTALATVEQAHEVVG